MRTLAIDIETYSPEDLMRTGVYRYAEHDEFEILLFAYAFDGDPVRVVDIASGEYLPSEVIRALTDPEVLKTAFNAAFERTCIKRLTLCDLPVEQWECTMVKSGMLGLPMSLDKVAEVLRLEQQKMKAGRALINYFSKPCKPTKANGGRFRNLPQHDPDKWELFKRYCVQDVETERAVRNKLSFFEIPEKERGLYALDQKINEKGVLVDQQLVLSAMEIDAWKRSQLLREACEQTGLDNPNSLVQLKNWLSGETGENFTSLTKTDVSELIKNGVSVEVESVLKIRQELSKTSVKKYQAMDDAVCQDGRVRGLLQFYGANRTGRWAGRLVQVQNLPQNHLEDLELARGVARSGDGEILELLFGNVSDTLSQLIRTAFVAPENRTFAVADFSAIEARVIAWLANEKWRLKVFDDGGDIYCASASQMFRVPVEKHGINGHLRQKGKIAELALGYQGGKGALEQMGALRMGIDEKELQPIVEAWRKANPAIVALWNSFNRAALEAIEYGAPVRVAKGLIFRISKNILWLDLPSGRSLCYLRPKLTTNRFGGRSIEYEGMDQTTKQWSKQETYGGKLVENAVQAIARDCLAEAMLKLDAAGYNTVMHVHDECVVEVGDAAPSERLSHICKIMSEPIPWAKGLNLTADGYVTKYYKKD